MKKKGILFKLNIIYSIILIVLIIITSIVFASMGESAFNFREETRNDISEVYDIDNLKKISISVRYADINIVSVDREDVFVNVIGNGSGNMAVENINGVLEIKEKKWFAFFDFSALINRVDKLSVEVLVPTSFKGDVKINSVSGDIVGTNLNIDNLEIDAVSGKIDMTDISFEEINIDTVSSEIELKNMKGNVIDIDQVSGDTFIALKTLPMEIKGSTTSGKIDISLYSVEEKKEVDINFSTVSGRMVLDPTVTKNSSSKHSINVNTISGDLQVR